MFKIFPPTVRKHKWLHYRIKKGRHSSLRLPVLLWDNPKKCDDHLRCLIYVHDSWIYDPDEVSGPGWNKIIGFSDGRHHRNSLRLVYQCRRDEYDNIHIMLGSYAYVDGVSPQQNPRQKKAIGTVLPGELIEVDLRRGEDPHVNEPMFQDYGISISNVFLPSYIENPLKASMEELLKCDRDFIGRDTILAGDDRRHGYLLRPHISSFTLDHDVEFYIMIL